jgi:hypothetical protein
MYFGRLFLLGLMTLTTTSLFPDAYDTLVGDIDRMQSFGSKPLSYGIGSAVETQGALIRTTNATGFAISGAGFFTVYDRETNTVLLTRNGMFHWNKEGLLCDQKNFLVLSSASDLKLERFIYIDERLLHTESGKGDGGKQLVFRENGQNPFLILDLEKSSEIATQDGIYFSGTSYTKADFRSILQNTLELSPFGIDEIVSLSEKIVESDKTNRFLREVPEIIFHLGLTISYFFEMKLYSSENRKHIQEAIDTIYGFYFSKLESNRTGR